MACSSAMRAKVKDIHPASSSASAMTNTGIADFHLRAFSSISAFSMFTRVVTNCRISSLVSDRMVARDFSVCTFRPPDSQADPYQKAHDPCGHGRLHRVFAHRLVDPKAGAEIT